MRRYDITGSVFDWTTASGIEQRRFTHFVDDA